MKKNSFAEKIKNLFKSHKSQDDAFYDELLDLLIEGDIGAKTAMEAVDALQKSCHEKKLLGSQDILHEMKNLLLPYVKKSVPCVVEDKVNIWMILGVNGVGKTTTCAKLALMQKKLGVQNVVLSASDTFRAAAIEQLCLHGKNLGIRVVNHQNGSDPSAVVFDASDSVRSHGGGLVIADTAGRLHNKENLVQELKKIDRVCEQKSDQNCYKKILVVDATTGQNALRQAEVFNEAVGLDSIVLTKYDSSAKGGIIITIGKELGIPVSYICTGEKYENIEEFNCEKYIDTFLGI